VVVASVELAMRLGGFQDGKEGLLFLKKKKQKDFWSGGLRR
jgi:hypothetical protein